MERRLELGSEMGGFDSISSKSNDVLAILMLTLFDPEEVGVVELVLLLLLMLLLLLLFIGV